jgi:ribonuclease-3
LASQALLESQFIELESKLGVSFTDRDLLRQALTHESFVNEWCADKPDLELASYERLEYLGDAVLNYTVAMALFEKSVSANEGELSMGRAHIVCKDSLAGVAQRLELGDHILRGKGEISYSPQVRDSVLEDSFEAIIGAIHVDQGYEAARHFVFNQLGDKIDHVAQNGVDKDPKSAFQEMVQGVGLKTPWYLTELVGNDMIGQQNYRAHVYVDGSKIASGFGSSKSKAQKNAAAKAINLFTDGLPRLAKLAKKRKLLIPGRKKMPAVSRSESNRGSIFENLKRFGSRLRWGGLRKSEAGSGRQLIFKRSE